jgi:hypothetical protein
MSFSGVRCIAIVLALIGALIPARRLYAEPAKSWRIVDGFAPFFDPQRPPPNSWAMPFGHMDQLASPYVNTEHMEASVKRFERYCDLVAGYGYTHVIVGNLIHLVSFEKIETEIQGGPLYKAESPFQIRSQAYKNYFAQLVAIAAKRGMGIVVETDFPAVTPELMSWLGAKGYSIENPRLWLAYKAAFREILEDLGAAAISIRIGEGGGAYNEATGYRSYVSVRSVEDAQAVLRGLLSLIDDVRSRQPNKMLLFRTWTIGIGEIGALHTNPALYERVFKPFYGRPGLMTLIKHVAMDFFEYVPRNPTIGVGEIPQIVEFQARREYEGFGLFANDRTASFKEDMKAFQAHKNFSGISVWPTNGGFLMPARNYLGLHGFDSWIDLNTRNFAALAQNSDQSPLALTQSWARSRGFSESEAILVAEVLAGSLEWIKKGLYIRPYAERTFAAFGLDVFPPMLWFYWNRPGSGRAIYALIHRRNQGELEQAFRDGKEALEGVQRAALALRKLAPSPQRDSILESLAFQESAFQLLQLAREGLLAEQAWAASGRADLSRLASERMNQLELAIAEHRSRYQQRSDFPALDCAELERAISDSRALPGARSFAAILSLAFALLTIFALSGLGEVSEQKSRALCFLAIVGPIAAVLATLQVYSLGHAAPLNSIFAALVVGGLASFGLALRLLRGERAGDDVTALEVLTPALAPLFAAAAIKLLGFALWGPDWAWQLIVGLIFESEGLFSVIVSALAFWGSSFGLLAWSANQRWGFSLKEGFLACGLGVLLSLFVATGVLRFSGAPAKHLVSLNRALRAGPTVLDEGGTSVEDLVGSSSE